MATVSDNGSGKILGMDIIGVFSTAPLIVDRQTETYNLPVLSPLRVYNLMALI